jgi:predicted DNA-binding transcriptional regulator AlpA
MRGEDRDRGRETARLEGERAMSDNVTVERDLLAASDIAELCGMSPSAISNYRARANVRLPLPAPAHIVRGRPLWRAEDIRAWLRLRLEHARASVDRHERAMWNAAERAERYERALAAWCETYERAA